MVLADDSWAPRASQAYAALEAARIRRDRVLQGPTDAERRVAEAAVAQARATVDAARLEWIAARSAAGEGAGYDPRSSEAQTRYEVAESALEVAEARLDLLNGGATEPELRLVEAALRRAEAALALVDVQQERLRVRAPAAGTVTDVFVQEGAQVTAGSPLVRLVDTDPITLTIYVPEVDLANVHVGDAVDVTVDSFEDEVFAGRVVAIGSEAEFTPKNVQTSEDRASLVYAVTIEIPNPPDGALKPGMPADAAIRSD